MSERAQVVSDELHIKTVAEWKESQALKEAAIHGEGQLAGALLSDAEVQADEEKAA